MVTHNLNLTPFSRKLDASKEVDTIFKWKQNLFNVVHSIQ